MATAWNDVTGARLVSKANNKAYDANYDGIFKPKAKERAPVQIALVLPSSQVGKFTELQLTAAIAVAEFNMIDISAAGVRASLFNVMEKPPTEPAAETTLTISANLADRMMALAMGTDINSAVIATHLAYYYIAAQPNE